MRRRAEALVQTGVQVVFAASRQRPIRHLNAQAPESRGRNQNQERGLRHPILRQISKALLN
jgi:hypothetical protein